MKVVFLDIDGVLNVESPDNLEEAFELLISNPVAAAEILEHSS